MLLIIRRNSPPRVYKWIDCVHASGFQCSISENTRYIQPSAESWKTRASNVTAIPCAINPCPYAPPVVAGGRGCILKLVLHWRTAGGMLRMLKRDARGDAISSSTSADRHQRWYIYPAASAMQLSSRDNAAHVAQIPECNSQRALYTDAAL